MKNFTFVFILIFATSCKNIENDIPTNQTIQEVFNLKYAKGFSLIDNKTVKVLEIKNPWPEAKKTYRYALIDRDKLASTTLNALEYDGIIVTPIEKTVVTSTTHIPALELLGVEQTLIGFPGCDYISSKKSRELIKTGLVRELGKNEGVNTEVLLELNPDVVIGFGVDGTNKSFETIKRAHIPVIYNGDWVETSPLAKAEWIKFFGILFNKQDKAETVFKEIEADYLYAKQLASIFKSDKTILSGAMHKDIWYLPNGTSPEAQLLKDANVNYLWKDTSGKGSLALSFESVFEKAQHADIWLSPSYYKTIEDLKKANMHYTKFDAFSNNEIYSFTNTEGETGGILYYELGIARPDLVLKDIIKICHPYSLPDYETFFFKKLL